MRIQLPVLVLVLLAALPGIASASASEAEGLRWVTRVRGEEIGHEVVTHRTEQGRLVVESAGDVAALGTTAFDQKLVVDAETLSCLNYKLDVDAVSGPQTVEAVRVDGEIRFNVDARGRKMESKSTIDSTVLCMDNLIVAHYEVLGRKALRHGDQRFEFKIAVPQIMRTLDAIFEPGPVVVARIGESERKVREGKLSVANVLTRFWYDAEDGTAYALNVPSQMFVAEVEGWRVADAPEPVEEQPDRPRAWREESLELPSALGPLPATLTLPLDLATRRPAVLLLAGSGPNDRDETIGPNKPFRDIARGLAEHGVASLRVDKRTALLRRRMGEVAADSEEVRTLQRASEGMTLREEYIDDAIAALRLVVAREEVDPGALFVLGHSLGALAAPAVVRTEGAPEVRGVIVMAGAGRPLNVLLEEQVAFQARQAGMEPDQAAARARRHVAPLDGLAEKDVEPFKPILGASATYWRDVLDRDLPAELHALPTPVLLLQGEKDIQVRVEDYELLKAALESRDPAAYRAHLFPELNHLFIPVSGASTGAEYYDPGRVDPEVIRILAEWVRATAGGGAASREARTAPGL